MSISLSWPGADDLNRVTETRLRCYAHARKELEAYTTDIQTDARQAADDFLLAVDGDEAVGTATSMSFRTWIRGSVQPAQGVAWVGTIRTRRRGGTVNEPGVASQLMHELLRRGREREQVVSLLMPFRGSFYEHFGYGLVERRTLWTVPISVFPKGFSGLRFLESSDRPALQAAYQRAVERGQCELKRSPGRWKNLWDNETIQGFEVIDRPDSDGPVLGYLQYDQIVKDGKDYLRVHCQIAEDLAAFKRQLHFLAGLKDQYFAAQIALPGDCPLNWYLTERQLPHRLVNHPVAEARAVTRLQARILDHRRLIEAMHLPVQLNGQLVVGVQETEGTETRLKITFEAGRATVSPTQSSAEAQCTDVTWAAVVLGGMTATQAIAAGLMTCSDSAAVTLLDAFSAGPVPFCQEPF